MGEISLDYIPKRSKDILSRQNPGQSVSLMNIQNIQDLYMIDSLAAEVWMLIDDKSSLAEITQKMLLKHDLPLEQFHRDLRDFIVQLQSERILLLHD